MTDSVVEPSSGPARGRWLRGLYLDLRSLALFRIALALCVFVDLLIRIPQIDDFYTDRGVMPREAIFGQLRGTWALSLHFISGQWAVQLVLFSAGLAFAIGLMLGYRTRVCAGACWFLVMSMQVRSPLILHSGDDLFRMLLFWSMFVPLNGRYSLDRALNPSAPHLPVSHLSPASLALIFQICAVYWYTAAEKMHPIWLSERTAVYYALNLDQFATPFGKLLLDFPLFLRGMTTATLLLEALGPLMALSPVWTGPLRLLAVSTFLSFHAGLGLSLRLGLFPWVCAVAWLVFLPGTLWDFLTRRLGKRAAGAVIFYDAGCGFCLRSVLVLREMLLRDGVEIKEAQSDAAIHALMREGNSWIVRDPGGSLHAGYGALVTLCRLSPVARWLAWVLGSAPARAVGDRAYRWVSSHRELSSRALRSVTPPPPRAQFGRASSIIALVALVLVEATLSRRPTLGVRALAPIEARLITLTQLNQSWRMFSPYPYMDDGWYVMEGITKDGRRVDLWNGGGTPNYEKPADFGALFRDSRWQKYLTNLWQPRLKEYRVYLGRYLCRNWNERHSGPEQVDLIYINYMLEWTPPPGKPLPTPTKESVLRHDCSEPPSPSVAATHWSSSGRP